MDFSGFEPASTMREGEGAVGATSFIDPNTSVEGAIHTDRDLRIEGRLSGKIGCDGVLMVAEGAVVDAEIDAASIVVAGEMSGTIRCRGRLEIRATGVVRGDVRTGALVILEGARYEGQIAMEERAAEQEYAVPEPEMEEDPELASAGGYSFLRRFAPEEDDAEPVEDDQES